MPNIHLAPSPSLRGACARPRRIAAIIAAALLAGLAAGTHLSAVADDSRALSWKQVVESARLANPELYSDRARIAAARARENAAEGSFYPQVFADASYRRRSVEVGVAGSTDLEDPVRLSSRSSESVYSASVSVEQSIFSGFGDVARVEQAGYELGAAEAEILVTDADLTFSLRQSFADILFSEASIDLSRRIVERRRGNRELVGLRFEGGREHKGSFLRSEAQLTSALYDVERARRQRIASGRSLLALMGDVRSSEIEIVGTLLAAKPPDALPNLDDLAVGSPRFAAAASRARSARAALTIARSQAYPSLSAVGTSGRTDDEIFPDDYDWTIGVSMSLPIFTGGRIGNEVRAAFADLARAEADAESERNRLVREISDSLRLYTDAYDRQAVEAKLLSAAELRAEIARSQYTSGLLTYENWDIIENDLINAERSALQSRRDAVVAEARWKQSLGQGELLP